LTPARVPVGLGSHVFVKVPRPGDSDAPSTWKKIWASLKLFAHFLSIQAGFGDLPLSPIKTFNLGQNKQIFT